MTARKKIRKKSTLAGRKASVVLERNGAAIRIDDVPAAQAGLVLADMLATFRVLQKKYPELVVDLEPVNGGTPIDVVDDDWQDDSRAKRVGFVAHPRRKT